MTPETTSAQSGPTGSGANRRGVSTRPSAEELALLDELDRLARLRSSTPPSDREQSTSTTVRPTIRFEAQPLELSLREPVSPVRLRESSSEIGTNRNIISETLPVSGVSTRRTDSTWSQYPRFARAAVRYRSRGRLPSTRSSSTLAELGQLAAAANKLNSSSSSTDASTSATPRVSQKRPSGRMVNGPARDFGAKDGPSRSRAAGVDAIIGRVAIVEATDWTGDFCFPENKLSGTCREQLVDAVRSTPATMLFRVPSAPVFPIETLAFDSSSRRTCGERDDDIRAQYSSAAVAGYERNNEVRVLVSNQVASQLPSLTDAHVPQTGPMLSNPPGASPEAFSETRSPGSVRTRHPNNLSETLVAASLSPRSRMLIRTASLTEPPKSSCCLDAGPAVARDISSVFDAIGDEPEKPTLGRNVGAPIDRKSIKVAIQSGRTNSPAHQGTCTPTTETARTRSASMTSEHSSETSRTSISDSDSDWDANLESVTNRSTTDKARTMGGFVPSAYSFDGGSAVSFEDGAIPAFFRIVDRARTLYRGNVIVRYPRPSSLVYLRIPESRAIQFGEKELELWLVGLVAANRHSAYEHPLLPPNAAKWLDSLSRQGRLTLLNASEAVESIQPDAKDEASRWALFAALSIAQIRECARLCREQQAMAALQMMYQCFRYFEKLLARGDVPAGLEPWLGAFFLPAWSSLLPRLLGLDGIPQAEPAKLLSSLEGIIARLSPVTVPALHWQCRLLVSETLVHLGPECFSLAPATFWDRVYVQPLRCLLQFSGPCLELKREEALDIEVDGDHLDEASSSKSSHVVEDFGPSHVTARAGCLIYWLLHGISPFNLEPLDYDFFESDEMLPTLSRMLPLTLQQHFSKPVALCTFLIRQCMPQLPMYCEARCRCSALLGHYTSQYEQSSQAESHYFEALFVLSGCPGLADDSPFASEFAQSLLERYAETLRCSAKYRYAVAALTAAADAFRKRLGRESNLLLQRISELALSEQDYVRAIQANIALLRAVCLEGQLLQAIHVTLRLGHILVEAGWFIRAEQLLTAVWQALEDAAPGLTRTVIAPTAVPASGKLPAASALMDHEQRNETCLRTLLHPLERLEHSGSGNVVDPRNHDSTSAPVSMRTERRTVECHLSDILLLLSDVRVRAGHAESALQPLFQLQNLLPPRRQAIIDRKLADIWLRLGNTAACRQSYLRYLAKSWLSSVGVSVAPPGVSSSAPIEDVATAPEGIWAGQPSGHCEWHQALEICSFPDSKPSARPKPEGDAHCVSRTSASPATSGRPLLYPSSHGVVRSRPPPEATILALLYEERYLEALEEIDCATEMTNSRRLRNLARLMHLRGQVLCEIACRLECIQSVPSTSSPKHVLVEPRERLCLSRLQLIPPMKLLRQLPDSMQRVWKRWIARLAQRPDVEPSTVVDVVVSARRSFDAAAYLYSVMADEIYAAMSTVSALRTDVEWAFRRLVRADSSIEQTRTARPESSSDAWTGSEPELELCEERLIEAASVFMETNLVQASMEVSVTMAQLMLLRRYPDAAVAFLREAWATFYSLYVDARTARFAFSGMASPVLVKELRQLLNRMVLVLYCLPSRICLEMQLLLDVHNQLVLETVLAESRHATRANLSSTDTAPDERYRSQQRSAENGVASCPSTGLRMDRSRPRPTTIDAFNGPHPSAEDELRALSRYDALDSAGSGSKKRLHALHDVVDSSSAPAVTTESSYGQKPVRRNRFASFWVRSTGALRRMKPIALCRGERSLGMTSTRLERTWNASRASGGTRMNEAATQTKLDASRMHQRSTKERSIRTPEPGCQANTGMDAARGSFPESEHRTLESAEKRVHQQRYSTFELLIDGGDSRAASAPAEKNCIPLQHRACTKPAASTNDKQRISGASTISSDQQPLAESAALGALFEKACARIVRDVLDDTRRSETAQLCALLQQLDWHEANSPNALNRLFGSDDPVRVAWSMQQRFEMQTERYRRGEVSTSELARYNEESLEIWLHEMGKLRERIPTTGAAPTKMPAEAAASATTAPATSTWTSFPSDMSSASTTLAALPGTGTTEASTMLALQAIAPDMLYVCNVGGLVCVYNLLNGFRYLFAWEPGRATATADDSSQDGFCLVPQSCALGGVPGLMSSETAPLGQLQRLEGHSALFLPIAIDQNPWLVTGQTVLSAGRCFDQPKRSWHSSDIASVLGIQRDQWLSSGSQRYRQERSLGLLLCDPTLYLVPWELLLEAPLMRACCLQDYLERQRYVHCDVSDISQIVMFHLERKELESSPLYSPAADGVPTHSVPLLAPNPKTASSSDASSHTAIWTSRVSLPACCATDWAADRAYSSDSSDRLEATSAKQASTVVSGAYPPPESISVREDVSLALRSNRRSAVVATSLAKNSFGATDRPSAGASVPVSLLSATEAEKFERPIPTRGRVVASADTSAKPPTLMDDSSIRPIVQVLPVSCMEPSQRGSLASEHTQVRPENSLHRPERPCLPPGDGGSSGGSCSSLAPAYDASRLIRPLTESGERLWSSARALLARRPSNNNVPAQVRSGSALLAGTCPRKLTGGQHAESRLGSSAAIGRLPQTHSSGSGASRAAVDTITAICLFPYHDLAQPGRILLEMRALCPNTIVVFVPIRQLEWFKAAMIGALRYRDPAGQARSVQELIHALLMSCLHQQVPVAFMHGTLEH